MHAKADADWDGFEEPWKGSICLCGIVRVQDKDGKAYPKLAKTPPSKPTSKAMLKQMMSYNPLLQPQTVQEYRHAVAEAIKAAAIRTEARRVRRMRINYGDPL